MNNNNNNRLVNNPQNTITDKTIDSNKNTITQSTFSKEGDLWDAMRKEAMKRNQRSRDIMQHHTVIASTSMPRTTIESIQEQQQQQQQQHSLVYQAVPQNQPQPSSTQQQVITKQQQQQQQQQQQSDNMNPTTTTSATAKAIDINQIRNNNNNNNSNINNNINASCSSKSTSCCVDIILDIDLTLVSSTKFTEIYQPQEHARIKALIDKTNIENEAYRMKIGQTDMADNSLPLVSDGLYTLSNIQMWTKLRPGCHRFLKTLSMMKNTRLHAVTNGEVCYAEAVMRFLDPTREIFGNRVIARNSISPKNRDKTLALEQLGISNNATVLMIDDDDKVWPSHQENLILVEKYLYFPSSAISVGVSKERARLMSGKDEHLDKGIKKKN